MTQYVRACGIISALVWNTRSTDSGTTRRAIVMALPAYL
jgi:hypothetical protein